MYIIVKEIVKDYLNARIVIRSVKTMLKEKGEAKVYGLGLGIAENYFIKQYFKAKNKTIENESKFVYVIY